MTAHADILDQRDPMRGALMAAITLHVALIGGAVIYEWIAGERDSFGAKDAGAGAVGVEAVNAIPLPHRGMENPVANDTQSEVPQQPVKSVERVKQVKAPPDAVKLKDRTKKKLSDVVSSQQRYRPFEELAKNQMTATQAPSVANKMFQNLPGGGQIGTGVNSTLGTRFPGYAEQLRRLVAQKWRTGDLDASLKSAPVVIATFDLLLNGNIRNLKLLQPSGIAPLDNSVQRAIMDASPFPPIPAGYERESAQVEFWFELKR